TADYLSTFTAVATGGTGTGGVSFAVTAGTACTVGAGTGACAVTSGTGSCTVQATKGGDDNYTAVSSNTQTLTAQKIAQAALVLSGEMGRADDLTTVTAVASSGTCTGGES